MLTFVLFAGWKDLNEECKDLMQRCYADASIETKAAQMEKYRKFCDEFSEFLDPIPCNSGQVALYVSFLTRSLQYSSVKGYISALSMYLKSVGQEGVDYKNYRVYAALRGARRTLGDITKQAAPILPHHILNIQQYLTGNTGHVSFKAALLLSFRALLRKQQVTKSEATLRRGDVTIHKWGLMLTVRRSKTIQYKQRELKIPVSRVEDTRLCAVTWIEKHMAQMPAGKKDPLFMIPGPAGPEAIPYKAYQLTLKMICKQAGLDPSEFSSHSLRRGGATYLGMVGASVEEIKTRGDWSSECYMRYLKTPLDVRIQQDLRVASVITRTAGARQGLENIGQ